MIIVTFTSHGYEGYIPLLKQCCDTYGITHRHYNEEWLHKRGEFKTHQDVFSARRGFGYWAWKPLVILDAFEHDDLVVYLDSSVVFERDPHEMVEKIVWAGAYEMMAFTNNVWTKRDAFVYMNCDNETYWHGSQFWGGAVVFHSDGRSMVEEWRDHAMDVRIISDNPNTCGLPNIHDFKENRHDQSILSLLCLKYTHRVTRLTKCFRDRWDPK